MSPLIIGAIIAAVFGANGLLVFVLSQRMVPKVEQIRMSQSEQSAAVESFNALAQRQNDEIARKDAAIAARDHRIEYLQDENSTLRTELKACRGE